MSETVEPAPSFTLILSKPVNFDGREYAQLILQEPSAKTVLRAEEHLRNGASFPAMRNREIHLVALTAGVPVPVVEQIKISDLNRGMAYINPFLTAGQATGAS
jgi:hypothetical protein